MKMPIGIYLTVITILLVLVTGGADAAPIIYTDLTMWQSAVAGSTVGLESFEDSTLNPGLTFTSLRAEYEEGQGYWSDEVADGYSTTISFSSPLGPMWAVGGLWDLAGPYGPGSQIYVNTGDGSTEFIGEIPNTMAGTFWGFTTSVPFTSIILSKGSLESQETFFLDDFRYASTSVPEPATMLLLGLGLMGLAEVRRKFKK